MGGCVMTSDKEAPVPDHMLLHKDSINRVLNFIHPVQDCGVGALFLGFYVSPWRGQALWNMVLPFLGFNGWCLEGLLLYVLVNIQIVGFERPSFIFFFFFFCGVFGGRGICKALRDMNKKSYIWNNNILELCLNGWQWQDFFFLSFLSLLDFIDYHNLALT